MPNEHSFFFFNYLFIIIILAGWTIVTNRYARSLQFAAIWIIKIEMCCACASSILHQKSSITLPNSICIGQWALGMSEFNNNKQFKEICVRYFCQTNVHIAHRIVEHEPALQASTLYTFKRKTINIFQQLKHLYRYMRAAI